MQTLSCRNYGKPGRQQEKETAPGINGVKSAVKRIRSILNLCKKYKAQNEKRERLSQGYKGSARKSRYWGRDCRHREKKTIEKTESEEKDRPLDLKLRGETAPVNFCSPKGKKENEPSKETGSKRSVSKKKQQRAPRKRVVNNKRRERVGGGKPTNAVSKFEREDDWVG